MQRNDRKALLLHLRPLSIYCEVEMNNPTISLLAEALSEITYHNRTAEQMQAIAKGALDSLKLEKNHQPALLNCDGSKPEMSKSRLDEIRSNLSTGEVYPSPAGVWTTETVQ